MDVRVPVDLTSFAEVKLPLLSSTAQRDCLGKDVASCDWITITFANLARSLDCSHSESEIIHLVSLQQTVFSVGRKISVDSITGQFLFCIKRHRVGY